MRPLWRDVHCSERGGKLFVQLVGEMRVDHPRDFIHRPDMARDSSRNRWRGFERSVLRAEIVAEQAERDHVCVVFEFLAECIREPRVAPVCHPKRQIRPLHVARAHEFNVWRSKHGLFARADTNIMPLPVLPVDFDELREARAVQVEV